MTTARITYRLGGHRRRAITFLEIMVVVTILGVLLAVSAPSLRNMYQKMQLHSSARQIGSLCKYARAAAIMKEGEVRILFDLNSMRYRLQLPPEEEDGGPSGSRYRDLEKRRLTTVEEPKFLPPDVDFVEIMTDAPAELDSGSWVTGVVFYQNGSATPCIVTLKNRRDRRVTIEVQHATGAVRIYMGDPVIKQQAPAEEGRGYTRQSR